MPGSVPNSFTITTLEIYLSSTGTPGHLTEMIRGAVTKPATSRPIGIVTPPTNNPK
ncbi:hypothetical protein BKA60DRAFT_577777 [Fusarium oxysporum]|nr:hypothetical protein BKA60DRAFT_577777 [Fusarium oxysporum]